MRKRNSGTFFSHESEVRNICAHSSGWMQCSLVPGLWRILMCISEAMILRDRLTSRFRETKQLPKLKKNCIWRSFRPSLTGTAHFLLPELKWPDFLGSQSCRRLRLRAHPDDLQRPHLWPSSLAASLRRSMTPRCSTCMLVRAQPGM